MPTKIFAVQPICELVRRIAGRVASGVGNLSQQFRQLGEVRGHEKRLIPSEHVGLMLGARVVPRIEITERLSSRILDTISTRDVDYSPWCGEAARRHLCFRREGVSQTTHPRYKTLEIDINSRMALAHAQSAAGLPLGRQTKPRPFFQPLAGRRCTRPLVGAQSPAQPITPQQSWGFGGEPPEAVMKDCGTRDGTL
jgi:hypothetical protein